ncbi:MAG TPA: MogA/MoaB family molybdenum cofactor biosynthesis protein [Gemmatimonadaceae bacterium]|nr:MogA/MoaB family molybdenum cofactor biosynthesis protein [Gemmatimonadaceae bacterium]
MSDVLPEGTRAHRAEADRQAMLRVGVLTVSDSRTQETDESGPLIRREFEGAGDTCSVAELLPNDESRVRALVDRWLDRDDIDVIIVTGGTGLGSRDRSIEAMRPLVEKEIPGFGELFRLISYREQVGTSAILSRAFAFSARGKAVVVLPGSRAAVELAVRKILLPELKHLLREIRR